MRTILNIWSMILTGDGKSEVILKTAPGSKDGEGNYVSKAGKNITKGDDKKDYRNSSGLLMGKD